MARGYSKEDVSFHSDGFGRERLPAANVKVRRSIHDVKFPVDDAPDELTLEMIESKLSEDYLNELFWHVCSSEWEWLEDYAKEIFEGWSIEVEAQGRSGGWACVKGLPDIEEWDAVLLAKWRKFERAAKETADYIPEQMVISIGINEYETWEADAAEEAGLHRDPVPA